MKSKKTYPVVLSIAGSDSSGGAGIQADLKTFSALGVYGATAITAITAQNTIGVHSQLAIAPQMVYDQILAVVEDLRPSFVKIGMLSNAEIVHAVAEALGKFSLNIVLDPVIVSTSGHRLLSLEAEATLKKELLPLSTLITPNLPEMRALTGMPLSSAEEKECAARRLMEYGAKAILLKGGHEDGDTKTDILYTASPNGILSRTFSSETIATQNTHGTGCTLSSAIASNLAKGFDLAMSVKRAKDYISNALSAQLDLGQGSGPMMHNFDLQGKYAKEAE